MSARLAGRGDGKSRRALYPEEVVGRWPRRMPAVIHQLPDRNEAPDAGTKHVECVGDLGQPFCNARRHRARGNLLRDIQPGRGSR